MPDGPHGPPDAPGADARARGDAPVAEVRHAPGPTAAAPRAPGAVVVAWRGLVLLLLCAGAAAVAEAMRGLVGGFGPSPGALAGVAAATLVAMLAVFPVATAIELPEAIFAHWIPERRWRTGRCPACGYAANAHGHGTCPECGAPFVRPAPHAAGWGTMRRTAGVAIPAWALGTAIGIGSFLSDERAFRSEVAALHARPDTANAPVERRRAGAASFATLQWSAEAGFGATTPFESAKDPLRRPPAAR